MKSGARPSSRSATVAINAFAPSAVFGGKNSKLNTGWPRPWSSLIFTRGSLAFLDRFELRAVFRRHRDALHRGQIHAHRRHLRVDADLLVELEHVPESERAPS